MFRISVPLLLLGLLHVPLAADEPFVVDLGQGVSMELVRIPKGEFLQGSPETESGREADEVVRRVTLSKDFFLGVTPVTVRQFRRFVDDSKYVTEAESGTSGGYGVVDGKLVQQPQFTWKNPGYAQTDDHPVTIVTYADALAFLKWLSGKSGRTMVLPTEAQWEYACRAGTSGRFYQGDDDATMDAIGWSQKNAANSPMPVRQKTANAFGLFDMSGNVYEWCQDAYNLYSTDAVTDPLQMQGQSGEKTRNVLRGGSWMRLPKRCRSAARYRATPGTRNAENGFRVAMMDRQAEPAVARVPVETPVINPTAEPAVVPALDSGVNAEQTHSTESSQESGFRGGLFLVGLLFFVVIGGMMVVAWLRYQSSSAGFEQEFPVDAPIRQPESRESGRIDDFAAGVMSGVLRQERDGFWILTSMYSIGTMLQCEYWADGKLFSETVEVNAPEKQFVYTGSTPSDIKVRIADSVIRPGTGNTMYPTESWQPESPPTPPQPPQQTYVYANPLDYGTSPSSRDTENQSPEPPSGRNVVFPPPAY